MEKKSENRYRAMSLDLLEVKKLVNLGASQYVHIPKGWLDFFGTEIDGFYYLKVRAKLGSILILPLTLKEQEQLESQLKGQPESKAGRKT